MSESAPRYVSCRCQHCDGGIEFDANELAEEGSIVPCPHCGLETRLFTSAVSTQGPPPIPQKRLAEIRTPLPVDSPLPTPAAVKQKRASQLAKLTEATIRNRTKSGDTPLHRAAKTGRFNEIPSHLLELELFLAKNNREETPLHFAAKHGCLNLVPSEFLTRESLTAVDYYGRTPLHVAADYGHADQIPLTFLASEFLSIPTKNFTSNTILHIVAGRNEVAKIPSDSVTAEMWGVENGYGLTPLEILNDILPTQRQLTNLRAMGIAFDESRLTSEVATDLIKAEHEKRRRETRMSLRSIAWRPSDPAIAVGPPAKLTVLAKSSSRKSPYKVDFMADGPSVRVYCHCQAGVQQWMCKHKLALILGDSNVLFDPGQTELLSRMQSWPQYSDLKKRTEEFQNKLREIEEAAIAEDSKFYAWLETRERDKQTSTDGDTPFFQIHIGIGEDDPEVQQKLEEMNEVKAELKRREKTIKEDFMLGLTLGFHRVGKSAV